LTRTIGERSIFRPESLARTADYIESCYRRHAIPVTRETYRYGDLELANVVADLSPERPPSARYLLGAHYDCLRGTVGADDNASAVAVQLETARRLKALMEKERSGLAVRFVSFALEEPPFYGTPHMGSRVYAANAKKRGERIDGMICLEMVGYTCHRPGCQRYPFPLGLMGYPPQGDFIGIVGDFSSRRFAAALRKSFSRNAGLPVIKLTVPFGGRLLPAVRLSDHASFWDAGYRAVMVTDSAFFRNPHYHRASDTPETLDYRFMAELVESLVIFFRDDR
ncbi:MAG: M28 family peptidase, partial [Desulfobacterales bacterium]|nr:M28 family peptidase [Desulfobacterales bacterium]